MKIKLESERFFNFNELIKAYQNYQNDFTNQEMIEDFLELYEFIYNSKLLTHTNFKNFYDYDEIKIKERYHYYKSINSETEIDHNKIIVLILKIALPLVEFFEQIYNNKTIQKQEKNQKKENKKTPTKQLFSIKYTNFNNSSLKKRSFVIATSFKTAIEALIIRERALDNLIDEDYISSIEILSNELIIGK